MSTKHLMRTPLATALLLAASLPAQAGAAPDVAEAQTLDRLEVVAQRQDNTPRLPVARPGPAPR
jgi:hypothetical protein